MRRLLRPKVEFAKATEACKGRAFDRLVIAIKPHPLDCSTDLLGSVEHMFVVQVRVASRGLMVPNTREAYKLAAKPSRAASGAAINGRDFDALKQ